VDALIIGGHFSEGHEDSLHHCDDFRLNVEGVPMSIPTMVEYFRNSRTLPDPRRRRLAEAARPYRQLYYSALHLYSLLVRNGYEAEILNCHNPGDPARLKLFNAKPSCVILSTTFMNMDAITKVAADVRKHLPDAWIVVGGAYARQSYLIWKRRNDPHYSDPEVLESYFFTTSTPEMNVDAFIYDEHGETTLLQTLDSLKRGERPYGLENTIVLRNGAFEANPESPESFDYDSHAIRFEKLPRRMLSTVVPFSATYGCPFKCGFCNFSLTTPCRKSFDVIFSELRGLATHNIVQRVWFTDDNFLLNERMVEEFCLRYIQESFQFSWMSFIRASSVTPRTAELLKRSNCCLLILGLESGSKEILRNMGKKDSVENYSRAMELLIKNDLDTEISFIFGYPGETSDTVSETIEFINTLPESPTQVNYLYLFGFSLQPLSPVFEPGARAGWGLEGHFNGWSHSTMSSGDVPGVLRRVATEAESTVFNYIDPEGKLGKQDLTLIMRQRDRLAKALLRKGNKAEVIALWDTLEASISKFFL
jgi:radical SAM superfamily enzyme YgiQ (UPF0313 family)